MIAAADDEDAVVTEGVGKDRLATTGCAPDFAEGLSPAVLPDSLERSIFALGARSVCRGTEGTVVACSISYQATESRKEVNSSTSSALSGSRR
jgi:hypothetical protein